MVGRRVSPGLGLRRAYSFQQRDPDAQAGPPMTAAATSTKRTGSATATMTGPAAGTAMTAAKPMATVARYCPSQRRKPA
jgi:hypothetical protein